MSNFLALSKPCRLCDGHVFFGRGLCWQKALGKTDLADTWFVECLLGKQADSSSEHHPSILPSPTLSSPENPASP